MKVRRLLTASIASFLLTACSGDVEESSPPSGAAIDTSAANAAVCLQGTPFVADGEVPVDAGETGTAHEVSDLRWESHEGCGRFVIDFAGEDGNPAGSVGTVQAEVRRDRGVVRIRLQDVEYVRPDATEASFSGLARAAYAVWSDEGRWVYVDLHLAEEAEAHVDVLEEPGRVVVDLRPGGPPIPPPAAVHERIVVLEPREGTQTYPLTISGYARTFEANVVARLEQGGADVEETFTTATTWADAWGHYSMTIEEGPTGPIVLHVGEYSARDGAWEGVSVELEMR